MSNASGEAKVMADDVTKRQAVAARCARWRSGLSLRRPNGAGWSRIILPKWMRRPYEWARLETFAPWPRVERSRRWVADFDLRPGASTRRDGEERCPRSIQPKDGQTGMGGNLSERFAVRRRHGTHPGSAA